MFQGVHDSLLIAYSVNSESERLTLSLRPHHGSAPGPFRIEFSGLIAYRFDAPLLPAIMHGLEETTATELIEREWNEIEPRLRLNGWPGSWAHDLDAARAYVEREGLKGYWLSSSYGLQGWILARSLRLLADDSRTSQPL